MASWIPKLNRLWKKEGDSESSAIKGSSETEDDSADKAAQSDDASTDDSAKATADESKTAAETDESEATPDDKAETDEREAAPDDKAEKPAKATADESETAPDDKAEKAAESDDERAGNLAEKSIDKRESASDDRTSKPRSADTQGGIPSRSGSAPPPPASLPPPIIPAAADSLTKSREGSVSRIPSLASRPPRKNSVPPIPVTRSSLSESPPSIRIVSQADLERIRHELITRVTKLEKALEAGGKRIRGLEAALEKERRERSKAIEERDHRILTVERGLKEEQDSWTSQVEERDEALFDLKLELETEHNRLADRMDNQSKLVEKLETDISELREKVEELKRSAGEARISDVSIGDDLTRIKGVGPRFERALKNQGVTTYEQIANWTEEDIDRIASQIRIKPERIQRERWVEGARGLIQSP